MVDLKSYHITCNQGESLTLALNFYHLNAAYA